MNSKKKISFEKGNLTEELSNIQETRKALSECWLKGDLEGFKDILSAFVMASNKKKLSEKTKLSRDTIYRVIKGENITIETAFEILDSAV
jgi:DNA-binding phage protein